MMLEHIIQKTDELRATGYSDLTISKENFDSLLQTSLQNKSFNCLVILLAHAATIDVKPDFTYILTICLTSIETPESYITAIAALIDFSSLEHA